MKVSVTTTIRSGPEAAYDAAAHALTGFYPNFKPIIDFINEPKDFIGLSRQSAHILGQLTFSYLSSEYLKNVVIVELDSLYDDEFLPEIKFLIEKVEKISNEEMGINDTSIFELNTLAFGFLDILKKEKINKIKNCMDAIGRYGFSGNQKKISKVMKASRILGLVLSNHFGIHQFSRLFREHIASIEIDDAGNLKATAIPQLENLRDHLLRTSESTCIFICPDIKIYPHLATFGRVRFHNWYDLVSRFELPDSVFKRLASTAAGKPFMTFASLSSESHPEDRHEALSKASDDLELVLGYFSTQEYSFHPPRKYEAFAFGPENDGVSCCYQSGIPQMSIFVMREKTAKYLEKIYSDFMEPVLTGDVEPQLRDRFRRAIIAARRAAFASGCQEFSQAYSCYWQAYEAIFGGTQSTERGMQISRRVSAMVVSPTGIKSDDVFYVDDVDFIEFFKEFKNEENEKITNEFTFQLIEEVKTTGLLVGDAARYLRLDPILNKYILKWKEESVQKLMEGQDPGHASARRSEKYAQVENLFKRCYRLRNDISHSSYENQDISETMFKDLAQIFSSFVINLSYNCSLFKSYPALLKAMDGEWKRHSGRSGVSPISEDEIRICAYYLWEERGQAFGDQIINWNDAKSILSERAGTRR